MRSDFPEYLTSFFSQYLKLQKGLSINTISSYSDAFILLFYFYKERYGIQPDKLTFNNINCDTINCFCQWLEVTRKSSIKTRNLRLTAIHSFFRYVAMKSPEKLALCSKILDISMKKSGKRLPVHLSDTEIKMLFEEPDVRTKKGVRDLAIMTVLYDSGARVSELTNLTIADVDLNGTSTLRINGKNNKMRIVPISSACTRIIKVYYKSNQINITDGNRPLFTNCKDEPLSRPGINYILDKYVRRAREHNPDYFQIHVTAHVMRHSKATHLLLSDVSLIYIRDFLGHASVVTTEIYAKTNPEFLREAIEKNSMSYTDGMKKYSEQEKENLTAFLRSFRK